MEIFRIAFHNTAALEPLCSLSLCLPSVLWSPPCSSVPIPPSGRLPRVCWINLFNLRALANNHSRIFFSLAFMIPSFTRPSQELPSSTSVFWPTFSSSRLTTPAMHWPGSGTIWANHSQVCGMLFLVEIVLFLGNCVFFDRKAIEF